MDHGDHSGHTMPMPMPDGEMDMDTSCSMNMLWNSQVSGTCVVFKSWYISGPMTMILSCIAITLVSIFYAYLLHLTKSFDRQLALGIYSQAQPSNPNSRRESVIPPDNRRMSLIPPIPQGYSTVESGQGQGQGHVSASKIGITKLSLSVRSMRAGLYALCVALSFWLMLVAMTYNTYLFASIILGSFVGHVMYEGEMDVSAILSGSSAKGLACH